MASKVNTKLVVFLIIGLTMGTGIIGALYVLNLAHNAQRSARIGDEAFKAGDLAKAHGYYGRAIHKDPGNLIYLEKLERTVLQMRPLTSENARELYGERLTILAQAARFSLNDPDRYVRLLDELTSNARRMNANRSWESVVQSADDMLSQISPALPRRKLAYIYRSLAIFHLIGQRTNDQVDEAMRDIQALVSSDASELANLGTPATEHTNAVDSPGGLRSTTDILDQAWATLLFGKITIATKMRTDNRPADLIAQQIKDIDDTIEKALKVVPNGPEVARMQLVHMLNMMPSSKQSPVTAEQLNTAADRMIALIPEDADTSIINEVVDVLLQMPGDNLSKATTVLERRLATHPVELDKRFMLSRLEYASNHLDQAEQAAHQVLDAETLTTSFASQTQAEHRKQAAAALVDIAHRRWLQATEADKSARMKEMEDARAKLYELVTDRTNDSNLLRADGKIAMSKGEYQRAAQCFEQLVKDFSVMDVLAAREVLLFSSYCLTQIGQIGLAHERIAMAVQAAPDNQQFVVEKARLELSMGQIDEAAATLRTLPQAALENEDVRLLAESINARGAGGKTALPATGDPLATALASANAAFIKGEIDTARATLLSILQTSPNNSRALEMLTYVEINAGDRDKARDYLAKAQSASPDDPRLSRIATLLKYDDPIEAIQELNKTVGDNDVDRAVAMMMNLTAYGRGQQEVATRLERENDADGAAKARALSHRALVEAKTYADQVNQLAPDNLKLLEYRFNQATSSQNWDEAEQLVQRAKALNADQADGTLYRGRLELIRGNTQNAIRSLESATDRLSFSAQAWSVLGYAYEMQSNNAQAQRAYERAYKCNPNDLDVVRRYVRMLRQAGQQSRALNVLRKVHEYAPQDKQTRDVWLDLEAQIGDKALALRTRKQIYLSDAKDRSNSFGLAKLLGELDPTRELSFDASNSPISEQRWTRMTTDERDQIISRTRQEWYRLSDQLLDEMVSDTSNELMVTSLRADLLRQRGQVVEGEQVLRRLIAKTDPASITAAMLIELGRYQARAQHFTDAIATYNDAIKVQDPKRREADLELALLYWAQLNRYELALTHLKAVYEVAPDRNLGQQIVEVLSKMRRFDEADQLLKKLTNESGDDFMTTMLSAAIAEGRGYEFLNKGDNAAADRQFTAQREALQRAEAQEPSSPMPRILLAQSLLNEFQRTRRAPLLDDALQSLDRADRIRPGAAEVSILRVAVLKAKGERAAAIGELQRHLDRSPDDTQRRRELVELFVDSREIDKAIKAVDDAIRLNPTIAGWYEVKGDLCKQQRGDKEEVQAAAAIALAAYSRAYELTPSPVLLLKIVEASAANAKPDCRANVDRIEAHPDDLAKLPALREQYVRALACAGNRDDAVKQAREAYSQRRELIKSGKDQPQEIGRWFIVLSALFPAGEGNPSDAINQAEKFALENTGPDPDVYELRALASMWLFASDRNLKRTLEWQRKAIDRCPADQKPLKVDLLAELANYLLIGGDNYQDASTAYETVLQLDPNNVTGLNNLAYIISERMADPNRALPYAERALELSPNDASVIDTVGWIHALAGHFDKARDYLEQSLRKTPSAITHIHMADVMVKMGRNDAAKQHLDDAEKFNPDQEAQQKIKTIRDDIQKARTQGR